MKSISILFFVGVLLAFATQISYAEVAVGNCKPHLVSYSTISEAVADVPPNSTILVCPGTYPEQVTISQPLILKGLSDETGARAVITVPSSGLNGDDPAQLSVQQPGMDGDFGPVDISNLIVDGYGFYSSTGEELTGIEFDFASGSLDEVEVRNQSFGIAAYGGDFAVNKVTIGKCNIHDFSITGILTGSSGGSGFLVDLTSNWIASPSANATGAVYDFAQGVATRNTIAVSGQGLVLENFFCCVTARENTVIGANVGIYLGGSDTFATTTVMHNTLFNNNTGILIYESQGIDLVKSNIIVQSSTAAIDVDCSPQATAAHNTISGAPLGIANVISGDIVKQNTLYNVPIATSACPS